MRYSVYRIRAEGSREVRQGDEVIAVHCIRISFVGVFFVHPFTHSVRLMAYLVADHESITVLVTHLSIMLVMSFHCIFLMQSTTRFTSPHTALNRSLSTMSSHGHC